MKVIFFAPIILLVLFGCDANVQEKIEKASSQRKAMNLKGKVKSLKEISFEAVLKGNQITKKKEKNNEHSSYLHLVFNESGNIIEGFNNRMKWESKCNQSGNIVESKLYEASNGFLRTKTLYFYDLNKRLKEEVGYFNDNRLFYRTEYKYDTIGNQIERYEYDSNNSLKRIKLYEYDEKGNLTIEKKLLAR